MQFYLYYKSLGDNASPAFPLLVLETLNSFFSKQDFLNLRKSELKK